MSLRAIIFCYITDDTPRDQRELVEYELECGTLLCGNIKYL